MITRRLKLNTEYREEINTVNNKRNKNHANTENNRTNRADYDSCGQKFAYTCK